MAQFADRRDAGRRLGAALARLRLDEPLVLGIARGGLVVAAEVAALLDAELGVAVARKLGAPGNPELGIGAVTADGTVVLDEEIAEAAGASAAYLEQEVARQVAEAQRRMRVFDDRYAVEPRGRNVILVDDGIATGVTARAALRALRKAGARHVVLAAPCAPPSRLNDLRKECDEVVVLVVDEDFMATGQYYRDFRGVNDDEVRDTLAAATRRPSQTAP